MVMIKPPINGKDAVSAFYDGPPPVPGTYQGEVTRMGLATVLSGKHEGADKIVVVVKITHGRFKGAEIFSNFTLTIDSAWNLNAFLEAMTDGSEKQRKLIKDWFWDLGYDVESEDECKNAKLGRQFKFIGKPAFKPIGKKVDFVTTLEDERANIKNWVIPQENSDDDTAEAELPDVATEETVSASEPETPAAVDDSPAVADESEAVAVATDDDDDPWS